MQMRVAEELDLTRFMGEWYVIANIPTAFEKNIYNAVESYRQTDGDKIATRFRYRKGGFDGPEKAMNPTGKVSEDNNAVWSMQFIWPFKAEYLVMHISPDYQHTIIGRTKRDYAWLMSREPEMDDEVYRRMEQILSEAGYDVTRLQKVPQRWPE